MATADEHTRGKSHGTFEHPVVFWLGAALCTVGVLLHLPMYIGARDMGYHLNGMKPDLPMISGMVLIVVGMLAALHGVLPRGGRRIGATAARIRVRTLDDAPITRQHVALVVVMAIAVTIDVMKPTALAFVAPGVAQEYGLKSPANPHGHIPVSWLPLSGIAGTVVGSLVWGWLGDRIGRRASIILAGMLFVSTSICGAMPGFSWNLMMCFIMGMGAGGMLPITFTLMAETIPARHRGWLMVLIGGDIAGAYVITSWLAARLTPTYSWRILWLIGLPTGLLFIALNRWIPESPRFLLATGRRREAEEVLGRYGAVAEEMDADEIKAEQAREVAGRGNYLTLFRGALLGPTLAITLLGVGVGLMTYGFQLWVPTNLQHLGYSAVNSDYVIRNAALLGLPLTVLCAWMYGVWGSRKTIVTVTGVTGLTLIGFVIAGNSLAHNHLLLSLLLVVPLSGVSSVVAVVAGYAAEVYPTLVRSRGTGLAAGMTKAGGVLILALTVAAAAVPSIGATALIGAVPLLLAAVIFLWIGPETKARRLEDINDELRRERTPAVP
ncbi:MFS transporter, putative metabolite:H+ symporter [Streptomyces sp. DvalAA-14]|uniref:MFS transporter n=1 Tax=unclassified Streptomyces TaxID=2593676 RepID=UPI00081B1ED7|nr:MULTISPECIES: MFS transporter [unclassified Streptomyces]MYS21647.1 MFS transporter [Streptomyces sp. SID4948]SCD97605.1 MFS transporter, putative metabolite:H+ symporter [Streptomyces sp. DvalAA-14]